MSIELNFDTVFAARLALREKQVQQSYRPVIGIHKWFARRPGSLFRNLLLAEYLDDEPLEKSYWHSHQHRGVIADPFMGGGTPLLEANRLGLSVVGADVNPMAFWILRQSLLDLDIAAFIAASNSIASDVATIIWKFYQTRCIYCKDLVPVKYFIWVKTKKCPNCGTDIDLFPGYLLAEAVRHPKHVVVCSSCGTLNEYTIQPSLKALGKCRSCGGRVFIEGPARRQHITCPHCSHHFQFSNGQRKHGPPDHRMWAIEYHCQACRTQHKGRFFKKPDREDLALFSEATALLSRLRSLPIPTDEIPRGDETDRLHRWGYRYYREMFNGRQLVGLGVLYQKLMELSDNHVRHALLTVFSDFLRYQNMLCRYDTYALKCQDVFSVHGFPVGLVQCENNLLGIPKVGSGSFRHFVEKYRRAKEYAERPFEKRIDGTRKTTIYLRGERIGAKLVERFPGTEQREAWLAAAPAANLRLKPRSLDGVFTDPPYFANVQYAELIDFCYVWLRLGLEREISAFLKKTTRSDNELTGNLTRGRDLAHFTRGLSEVFCCYSNALKPNAPFVFTYHHNNPYAYVPIVVAILDSGLNCTATLPAVAEMSASIHILGTASSVLDTVFVCRKAMVHKQGTNIDALLLNDARMMKRAGVSVREGDLFCLLAGHIARVAVNLLGSNWHADWSLSEKMGKTKTMIAELLSEFPPNLLVHGILGSEEILHNSERHSIGATV